MERPTLKAGLKWNLKKLTERFLLLAAIVVAVLLLILVHPSWMRILLTLPLIFFLPGYGITALLFPHRVLDIPARLLLSVGLSLATTAFSGLILHLTPAGIQLQNPLLVMLISGSGLLGLYFLVRDAVHTDSITNLTQIGFNARQVLLFVLAAVIAATAVMVARTPTSPNNLAGYTLFWVQPNNQPAKLGVGVRSEEFKTTKYHLRFEIKEILHDGPTFELKPGQTWEGSIELDGSRLAGQPVTLLLYRLDHPNDVYRRVVWYEND